MHMRNIYRQICFYPNCPTWRQASAANLILQDVHSLLLLWQNNIFKVSKSILQPDIYIVVKHFSIMTNPHKHVQQMHMRNIYRQMCFYPSLPTWCHAAAANLNLILQDVHSLLLLWQIDISKVSKSIIQLGIYIVLEHSSIMTDPHL